MSTLYAGSVRTADEVRPAVRRLRWIAEAVGLGTQDQTRVATALSDILHVGVHGGRVTVEVGIDRGRGREQTLQCTVAGVAPQIFAPDDERPAGTRQRRQQESLLSVVASLHRIVEHVDVRPVDRTVRFGQAIPPSAAPVSEDDVTSIVDAVSRMHPDNPYAEIQRQNRELVALLLQLHERGAALEDAARGVTALTAEVTDQSERLERLDELQRRRLRTVAHELRSPLYAARAFVEELRDGELGGVAREVTQQLDAAVAEALGLVESHLDSAVLGDGRVHPQRREVDVDALLSAVRGMVMPLVPSLQLALVFERDEDAATLRSDARILAQILRNLVGNAVKFTDVGAVRVHVAREGDAATITVADTGIGIDAAARERIFSDFEQVREAQDGRPPGTGLGLAIVARLVAALDGTIELDSQPGVGSTFVVRLPDA